MATPTDRSQDRLTLRFADARLERDFQAEMAATNAPQARVGALVASALWAISALIIPVAVTIDRGVVGLICGAMVVVNLAAVIASRWATTLDRQQVLGLALNGLAGLAVLVLIDSSGTFERYAAPALLLIAIFAFVVIRLRFVFALLAAGTYLVGFFVVVASRPAGGTALDIFLVSAAIVVGLGATYLIERGARDVFAQRRLIEEQAALLAEAHATSERLLLNILPAPVADRLKRGETTIADAYPDATVLFADLVDFTPLAAALGPAETVRLLDRLFSAYDRLAEQHGLEKIKSIGDAYMVVGGVPDVGDDHPQRVVAMGLDMLDAVARVSTEVGRPLAIRVGVHTGPVVAGVIGTRKFIYDLWGDTVNVASRLESHGVAGSVQMSEATWSRLDGAVDARPRGPVELKGRGTVRAYLVDGHAPSPQ
ncbi:MAG: adenylate cyclase [Chloroflexota bacterium]|nr:adenylate cyclase [Chloroflexota bacterium]